MNEWNMMYFVMVPPLSVFMPSQAPYSMHIHESCIDLLTKVNKHVCATISLSFYLFRGNWISLPSRLSSSSLTEREGSFFSFVSLCTCTITLCLTWELLTSGPQQPNCQQSGTLLKDSLAMGFLKPTGQKAYPPSVTLYLFSHSWKICLYLLLCYNNTV